MRLMACLFQSLLFLAACGSVCAQEQSETDALRDQLLGPIKSVVSTRISEEPPEQQKRIPFGIPPACQVCDYDAEGNKVTDGQIVDGKFVGNTTVIQRDANGYSEHITTSEPGQPTTIRQIYGPFGLVDATTWNRGLIYHEIRAYDAKGHIAEVQAFDQTGASINHILYKWADGKDWKQQVIYVIDEVLFSRETYDADTDENRYTSFDSSGAPLVAWTLAKGKVLSFWAASDDTTSAGKNFSEDLENGNFVNFDCQKSVGCTARYSHSIFINPGQHNLKHTDFRDAGGTLMWSVDYEYEFDSHKNWTHRKIWVTFPSESGRTLFAEDARIITYWDNN